MTLAFKSLIVLVKLLKNFKRMMGGRTLVRAFNIEGNMRGICLILPGLFRTAHRAEDVLSHGIDVHLALGQ